MLSYQGSNGIALPSNNERSHEDLCKFRGKNNTITADTHVSMEIKIHAVFADAARLRRQSCMQDCVKKFCTTDSMALFARAQLQVGVLSHVVYFHK